ncbi:MAG: hypothetical protein KDC98_25740, partial [Planctomycetes bacterium]|nr:hypothetical protein [Planctomycetota bacterium]
TPSLVSSLSLGIPLTLGKQTKLNFGIKAPIPLPGQAATDGVTTSFGLVYGYDFKQSGQLSVMLQGSNNWKTGAVTGSAFLVWRFGPDPKKR